MRQKQMSVLVVDDEHELADILKSSLESQGYFVSLANNGKEAIKILECGNIDVVVSDLLMAGGDGLKVREKARSLHLPLVFLTGYLESYLDLLPKGCVVLEKPYDLKELVDAIARSYAAIPVQSVV